MLAAPLVQFGNAAQQRIGKFASKHCADLRDFTSRTEPIKPRSERLSQSWRDRLNATQNAPLQEEAGHLLDEQRHAACPFAHALDEVFGERMTRG